MKYLSPSAIVTFRKEREWLIPSKAKREAGRQASEIHIPGAKKGRSIDKSQFTVGLLHHAGHHRSKQAKGHKDDHRGSLKVASR